MSHVRKAAQGVDQPQINAWPAKLDMNFLLNWAHVQSVLLDSLSQPVMLTSPPARNAIFCAIQNVQIVSEAQPFAWGVLLAITSLLKLTNVLNVNQVKEEQLTSRPQLITPFVM